MNGHYWNTDGEVTVHIGESLSIDNKIFRYMPFCGFQSFLDKGINIPKVSSFAKEDPFEGEYTETFYSHLKMVYEIKKDGRKYHGINCLKKRSKKHDHEVLRTVGPLARAKALQCGSYTGRIRIQL